jgi:hypothetical protein
VDIFAPRGTPVIAAAAGRVSRVGTDRQGGKVVWMEETSHRRRLYYAHLDSQSVRPGRMVKRGDTLGFVGNTGNAHTSPPHLHFAVYWQGSRAVDPYFHLHDPAGRPATFSGDVRLVGSWARTTAPTRIRAEPGDSAGAVSRVEALTPVQVLSGTGRWYLVRLPDGRRGYLGAASAGPLEPITMAAVATPSMLRTFPASFGFELDSIGRGQVVPVLGRYSTHTLVRHPNGLTAWIASGALAAGRTEVGGSNH